MTEATTSHPLDIPWFLNAKNPENIARRERAQTELNLEAEQRREKNRRSFISQAPAKSVSTAPKATEETEPAPKVKTAKLAKEPAKKTERVKKSSGIEKKTIRVLVSDFGHKPGSKAETKSNGLRDGMTVAEYMANDLGISGKWHMGHINHCVGKGFIKLED